MIADLNLLMEDIEKHLTSDFSIQQAAKKMGMSEYHLKRTFSFVAGMSLSDYIRNRKLALANQDLVNGEKVTDITFKYGYQSVEGFSRAFRYWSGYLPSEVMENHYQKSFPKLIFQMNIKGGVSLEFKIERKSSFHLVGIAKRVPIQFEGENKEIQKLAESISTKQKDEMKQFNDLYPNQVLNASYNFDEGRLKEKGKLTQLIGFATKKDNSYEDLSEVSIAEFDWAIFPNKGPFPQTLQDTWAKIYSEWLPSANYELVEAPEISFTKKMTNSQDVYSEVWIAVKEKE